MENSNGHDNVEKTPASLMKNPESSSLAQLSEHHAVNERALILKIDIRILPILVIVYIMAFIDR
jgi:hypothetical protein